MTGVVAITGASGFFGRHITAAAVRRNLPVRAVVRDTGKWQDASSRIGAGQVDLAVADLEDKRALSQAFASVETVIHNAALANPKRTGWDENYLANVIGTRNVVECVADAGIKRLLLISTIGVYRLGPRQLFGLRPVRVSDPVYQARNGRPRRPAYGVTKAIAETICRDAARVSDVELTILRTSATFGIDDPNIDPFVRRLLTKRVAPIPGLVFPLVYAEDAAAAVVEALVRRTSIGKTYNLPGPSDLSLVDFVRTWRQQFGGSTKLISIPTPVRLAFDKEEAAKDLGFANRPLASAFATMQELASGLRSLTQDP